MAVDKQNIVRWSGLRRGSVCNAHLLDVVPHVLKVNPIHLKHDKRPKRRVGFFFTLN